MSTKNNVLTALASVFSVGPDIEYDDSQEILMVHPALIEVLKDLGNKEKKVEEAVNVSGGSKKGKGGLKKYEKQLLDYFTQKIESRSTDYSISAAECPEIWSTWQHFVSGLNNEQLYSQITAGWNAFIDSVHYNRMLILLVQNDYINREFPEFNQLNVLEDTNTPWDWDHIYPSEWIHRKREVHHLTKHWNNTIGNLRAMSLSDNRRESNRISPKDRLSTNESIHKDYFIKDNDWIYWQKITERIYDNNEEMVTNHAMAIVRRMVNIYEYFLDNIIR